MPLPIVTQNDFVKRPYSIPQLNADTLPHFLELIRNSRQEYWVKFFLGDTEGAALIADLDANGVPQAVKYQAIFSEFNFVSGGHNFHHPGLKKQVTGILYHEWLSSLATIALHTGEAKVKSIAATDISSLSMARLWNDIAYSNLILAYYCSDNNDTYPDYSPAFMPLCSPL